MMSSIWDEAEDGNISETILKSTNSYLEDPIKGMKLISTIISDESSSSKSELDMTFDKFDNFLKDDFIKFSNQIAIANEAELYSRLINIRDELLDNIKFSELINKTNVGVGGSFSAGKSSFLNSILDRDMEADDILPIDSVPTTSIPTYLVQKDHFSKADDIDIYIFNKTGNKSEIDREALLAISHEFYKVYNFGLTSIINKIVIDIASMPYENIAFLDTPGYSKSDGDEDIDKNIAKEHLQNIDSLMWLIDADNGTIRDGDIGFIKSLNFEGDILFILNKADKKPLSDIQDIVEAIKDTLNRVNIEFVDVIAYSSHDREEYGTKQKIDNFLQSQNRVKIINFNLKILDILHKYKKHIDKVDKKSGDILELFNKLDLYSSDIINDIDNFDDVLLDIRRDKDKNRKNNHLYSTTKSNIIEIVDSIDRIFNSKLSTKQSKERDSTINIKEINSQKPKSIEDYIRCVKVYTDAIDVNMDKRYDSSTLKLFSKIKNRLLIDLNPKDENHYYQRAKCYQKIKEYDRAILDYSKAINLSPQIEEYYEKRVECYNEIEDYNQAIKDYIKLIELNPNYKKWYIDIGQCYDKLEDFISAIEDYSRVIELNPKDSECYMLRGKSYQKLGFHNKAIDDFTQIINLQPSNTEPYYQRAISYFTLKYHKEAIDNMNSAIVLDKTNPEYYYLKAEYLRYHKSDMPDYNSIGQILDNYEKAIELNCKKPDCYYQAAKYYMHSCRINDYGNLASKYINKAIELDPTNELYYIFRINNMGILYSDLKKLIELDPNNPDYHIKIAKFLIELRGENLTEEEFQFVMKSFDKAIDLNPNDGDYNGKHEEYKRLKEDFSESRDHSELKNNLYLNIWY